jgi:ribosomal protein L7/L12
MNEEEFSRRITELELKVHYLVQLVENLYVQLGMAIPNVGEGRTGAATSGPAADPEVLAAIASGELIAAIKRYRDLTGAGLKEAKDAVEAMAGRVGR